MAYFFKKGNSNSIARLQGRFQGVQEQETPKLIKEQSYDDFMAEVALILCYVCPLLRWKKNTAMQCFCATKSFQKLLLLLFSKLVKMYNVT